MKTRLDWSAYHGAGMGDAYADIPRAGGDFARAVAVCIGSRQCESAGKGVMCPSFRISHNPHLSTGGRVRLLKAALNSAAVAAALTDPTLVEALDLCVGCKGCKRECENAVDMAAIKTEYLAQCQVGAGVPLRARLFAELPRLLHYGGWLGPAIRLRNRRRWLARLAERALGISAARRLPEPAPRAFREPPEPAAAASQNGVALLVDTYTRHFHPEIAEAALDVLRAADCRPVVAHPAANDPEPGRPLCCGRTWWSQGLVAQARREARRMLAALMPHLAAGRPLVGLEPSCLSMLRDEYRMLVPEPDAELLGRHALLFEEFLARELTAKRLHLPIRAREAGAPPVLVHGHCHQKSVGAMKSVRKVLGMVPGLHFELIESSCCGMAGSFGYEAEHQDASRQMAELALLPALAAQPGAVVLTCGFSCRRQIQDLADRRPVHLAELLRDSLAA